jgi:hypothetical protein
MSSDLMFLAPPRGLAAIEARHPLVFIPDEKAAERFFDFFTSTLRNKNTRRAYYKPPAGSRNGARTRAWASWPA